MGWYFLSIFLTNTGGKLGWYVLVSYIWREPLFPLLLPPFLMDQAPLLRGVPAKFHKTELPPNLIVQKIPYIPYRIYQPASAGNLPIPAKLPVNRWDATLVFVEFGNGLWLWLFDTPSGYHQLAVALESQKILAFQEPDAIKWTYMVMPFGPTNGPATFINLIYDANNQWKSLASLLGTMIGEDTNTQIIINDIVSHGADANTSLRYMECQ
jgi:hypothetical protein